MTTTRRLAAILAVDVAGYSRLMGADEEAAPMMFATVQTYPKV
jgi:class 3 adenylate cyclase